MAKIVNISEIHPTLGFTEFDILEKYRKSFNESELGKLHSVFPFEYGKSCRPVGPGAWDAGTDSVLPQRLPHGPEGIHRILRQATGGTSEREHTLPDFLWNYDSPSLPITNFKIVSAIRNEIASALTLILSRSSWLHTGNLILITFTSA